MGILDKLRSDLGRHAREVGQGKEINEICNEAALVISQLESSLRIIAQQASDHTEDKHYRLEFINDEVYYSLRDINFRD